MSLDVEDHAGTRWVALDRPAERNALTPSLVAELHDALRSAIHDDVRVLVLAGRGPAFCAGTDLSFANRATWQELRAFLTTFQVLLAELEELPLPTVAAVGGVAGAGGLELALRCDLIVAGPKARIGDGHATYGLLPGGGAVSRLVRRVGSSSARRLLFTGELLDPATAVRLGLVDTILDEDPAPASLAPYLEPLVHASPLATRELKALVRTAESASQWDSATAELATLERHRMSSDYAEGLAAFAERRQPRFVGR